MADESEITCAGGRKEKVRSIVPHVVVDTVEGVAAMIDELLRSDLRLSLAVDVEAASMDPKAPDAAISVIQIIPMDRNKDTAFIVDVQTLGWIEEGVKRGVAFETPGTKFSTWTLRLILESRTSVKLMVDPRRDARMLFELYGVELHDVVDLQVVDAWIWVLARRTLDTTGARHPRTKMFKDGHGMAVRYSDLFSTDALTSARLQRRIIAIETAGREIFVGASSEGIHPWTQRPLSKPLLRYAALGVRFIESVYTGMYDRMFELCLGNKVVLKAVHQHMCKVCDDELIRAQDLSKDEPFNVATEATLVPEFELPACVYSLSHLGPLGYTHT